MPKPKQKSIQEQVVEDYKNKIEKAKGNDKIRLLIEGQYLDKITYGTGAYDEISQTITDYFLPTDDKGKLIGHLTRERLWDLAKFIDEEIFLPLVEFREKNPNHSDEWYSDHFMETKNGAYYDLAKRIFVPIGMPLGDYGLSFFGRENKDIYGRKREEGESTLSIILAEGYKMHRDELPPDQAGKLARAELTFMHGEAAMLVKPIQREVTESELTGEFEGWVKADLETRESVIEKQKALKKAEPKYDLRETGDALWIQFFKGLDYSFIKDDAMKKSISELHQDVETYKNLGGHVSKELYEKNKTLFEKLDNFSEKLEKADHLFWINSGAYNDVKKGVQDLRKVLIDGETPENKKAVEDAYKKLSDFCDVYQSKNPGVRKQKTGNQRKEIIADLKQFIQDQNGQPEKKNSLKRSESVSLVSFSELKEAQDKEQNKTTRRNSVSLYKGQASEKGKKVEGPSLQ